MKIIDISETLQDAPTYPHDPVPKITKISHISSGDSYNLSEINMTSHSGTHGDALSHYLGKNSLTIDEMPLEKYYGECKVVSVPQNTPISKETLFGKIENQKRIVLNSGGTSFLTRDGAEYIVKCKIETLVTDGLSIAPLENETEIHKIILSRGIAVIENVTLEKVVDGKYILCAFPLKIRGCDGAPIRAVLISE